MGEEGLEKSFYFFKVESLVLFFCFFFLGGEVVYLIDSDRVDITLKFPLQRNPFHLEVVLHVFYRLTQVL